MPSSLNLGKAIIDPTGKKPIRMGRSHDGFDMLAIGEQVKEITLEKAKKETANIEKNTNAVIPAINDLQAKVQSLNADAKALSNYLGYLPGVPNSFEDIQATVVKSGEYSQSAYVDVTVDSSVAQTTTNSVAISIEQLAVVDSRISSISVLTADGSTATTSADQALGISGTFSINGGSSIAITATDTLNTIISAINYSNSNVQATSIQNGSHFNLVLNGTVLATPLTFNDPGNLLHTYFGINTATPTDISRLQAKIQYNITDGSSGTVAKTYFFNTNVVTNLIPGVTIKLLNPTTNSTGGLDKLNINISNNTQGICDKILSFYKNFNDIRETLNRNLMTDEDGNPIDKDALMVRSPLVRQLSDQLDAISSFTLQGCGPSDFSSCQSIGIVVDNTAAGFKKGIYTIKDSQALLAAISNNFSAVKKLFGNYPVVSNSNFSVSDLGSLSSSIAGHPITITLSNTGGSYSATYSCGSYTATQTSATSNYFIGPAGTVFENITLGYTGNAIGDGESATCTVTATQGFAAVSSIKFDQSLDNQTGDFALEFKRIKDENEKLKKKVEKATQEAERIEKKWSSQAARLDVAREKYAQISKQLDYMMNYNTNNR